MLPAILPDMTGLGHGVIKHSHLTPVHQPIRKQSKFYFLIFPPNKLYLLLPCKAERSRRYTLSKYRDQGWGKGDIILQNHTGQQTTQAKQGDHPRADRCECAGFHSGYSLEPQEYSSWEEHVESHTVEMPLAFFCEANSRKAKKAAVAKWVGFSFQSSRAINQQAEFP